jgi:hypothetical protein
MLAHGVAFAFGLALVAGTLFSAVQTFILPRGANTALTRWVFNAIRRLFGLRLRLAKTYAEADSILALFAPISLMTLPPVWLALVLVGFTAMFWGAGDISWTTAFRLSGSSLFTLGDVQAAGAFAAVMAFGEAAIGLVLVALFIAYLPTMYAAFTRREREVSLLEVRAGSPPSAVEMITRYHRIHGLNDLHEVWETWEEWFADVEESHTSLAALTFFRSPRCERSWVTAAGAVLDAAAMMNAAVAAPHDAQADLCIRAGFIALRQIADFFRIPYPADPHFPAQPISISRAEFDIACDDLQQSGIELKADRDQAWQDFGGWRVNYDPVLIALAKLTVAPDAPWSTDRIEGRRW